MPIENKIVNCQDCARCCIGYESLVTDEEIEAIVKKTGIKQEQFTRDRYIEIFTVKVLEWKNNGECVFLDRKNGKYSCEIYDIRPKFCADYPSREAEIAWCEENKISTDSL